MSQSANALYRTELPGLLHRGKVRDVYDLGDQLMIVASDRISAFDVVMDQPVPGKGVVLTRLSRFWFDRLDACRPHHLLYVVDDQHVPPAYADALDQLRGRAMVCRKADVVPVECVVRGYLIGGGWKEYRRTGCVSGVSLPTGLKLAERLPEPIFTPSTKATDGHDQPISFERACALAGEHVMDAARDRSLAIYARAAEIARARGIILADTKFEFGVCGRELLLIDEVLTPDSSRFWPADEWAPGKHPPSFDKQFLRDYLDGLEWNKTPPPPPIPADILTQTRQRYLDGYRRLTGRTL